MAQRGVLADEFVLPAGQPRGARAVPDKVETEVEVPRAGAGPRHVLDGCDEVRRLEVTASKAKAPAEEGGDVRSGQRLQSFVGRRARGPFQTFGHGGADLPEQGEVYGEGLVDALENSNRRLPLEHASNQVGGERSEHDEVEYADLETA